MRDIPLYLYVRPVVYDPLSARPPDRVLAGRHIITHIYIYIYILRF